MCIIWFFLIKIRKHHNSITFKNIWFPLFNLWSEFKRIFFRIKIKKEYSNEYLLKTAFERYSVIFIELIVLKNYLFYSINASYEGQNYIIPIKNQHLAILFTWIGSNLLPQQTAILKLYCSCQRHFLDILIYWLYFSLAVSLLL